MEWYKVEVWRYIYPDCVKIFDTESSTVYNPDSQEEIISIKASQTVSGEVAEALIVFDNDPKKDLQEGDFVLVWFTSNKDDLVTYPYQKVFSGVVYEASESSDDEDKTITLRTKDWSFLLLTDKITKSYPIAWETQDIVFDIISSLSCYSAVPVGICDLLITAQIAADHIEDAGGQSRQLDFVGEAIPDALSKIDDVCDRDWYVDPEKDFKWFERFTKPSIKSGFEPDFEIIENGTFEDGSTHWIFGGSCSILTDKSITMQASGYVNCEASDIGDTVYDDGYEIGYLRYYDNTARMWLVQTPNTVANGSVMTIHNGMGDGKGTSISCITANHYCYDATSIIQDIYAEKGQYYSADDVISFTFKMRKYYVTVGAAGIHVTVTYSDASTSTQDFTTNNYQWEDKTFTNFVAGKEIWKITLGNYGYSVHVDNVSMLYPGESKAIKSWDLEDYSTGDPLEVLCNKVEFYGNTHKKLPYNGDLWSDGMTVIGGGITPGGLDVDGDGNAEWVEAWGGALSIGTTDPNAGSQNVELLGVGAFWIYLKLVEIGTPPQPPIDLTQKWSYKTLEFAFWTTADSTGFAPGITIELWAPDASNKFTYVLNHEFIPVQYWQRFSIPIGPDNEEPGKWTKVGSADWSDIRAVAWNKISANSTDTKIDWFHFGEGKYYGSDEDPTSQGTYGVKFKEIFDETVYSDKAAQRRAEKWVDKFKDPITVVSNVVADFPGQEQLKAGEYVNLDLPEIVDTTTKYRIETVTWEWGEDGSFQTELVLSLDPIIIEGQIHSISERLRRAEQKYQRLPASEPTEVD